MEKNKIIKSDIDFNGVKVSLETGKVAKLADAAVIAKAGDTTVLATVVSKPTAETSDFFPLRVDYEERYYAGGTIGGSKFSRREGKPSDEAIVSGRLIDHALRPLFAKDFMDEAQLVVTVLSMDTQNDPVLIGFLASSAAFKLAGLPFNGPIVPLRISKVAEDVEYSFSTPKQDGSMDLVVSYLDGGSKIQALEAKADIIPESGILEYVNKGSESVKPLFDLLNDFAEKTGSKLKEYEKSWLNKEAIHEYETEIMESIKKWNEEGIYYTDKNWGLRQIELAKLLAEKYEEKYTEAQYLIIIAEVQKLWVRDLVLTQKKRIDGRGFDEIRPLSAEVGVLPRVHGSAIFERGLTQGMTIATLASPSKTLLVQGMGEEEQKKYIHHYNFPPYSTGEVGKIGSTGRREIGHGMLAEKALLPVLPSEEEFPYVIRLVTEILSSNGSTSMAATCGSSLSLMDAGVPIKAHVAGIGVGLFIDDSKKGSMVPDEYTVLTDIVGYEDFAGYMDFKMTGTSEGITAIQMELKLAGIPLALLDRIFNTSHEARIKVLEVMNKAIAEPRKELSEYAPKIESVTIDKDQIGMVIGSGGAVIKGIMEEFGVEVDVEEKGEYGIVAISATDIEAIRKAKEYIEGIVAEVEIGAVYEGKVTRVEPYGAFIEILPKKLALLHVSEYSYEFVDDMSSKVKVGDTLQVKVTSTDDGKIAASRKVLLEKPEGYVEREKPSFNDRNNGRDGYNRDNRNNQRGGNRGYRPRNNMGNTKNFYK